MLGEKEGLGFRDALQSCGHFIYIWKVFLPTNEKKAFVKGRQFHKIIEPFGSHS